MNVLQAANNRLKYIFDNFDNVYLSFSGGKDSGVMLNLTIDWMRKNVPDRKLFVYYMHYEAQYTMTTEYVDKVFTENTDILEIYNICVPFKVSTCTSMYEDHWRPWDEDKQELWVSPLPKNAYTAKDFDFYTPDMWDYEFQERFAKWLHLRNKATSTASLIGIRTQESFHRWKALHAERTADTNFSGKQYSTKIYPNVYNLYPIFDWKTEDIWVANAKFGWSYNRLYDIFYQAGIPLNEMRVASPFLSTAQSSLKLYQIIEPKTWGKLIGRVNGVNFTGLYGGTTAMGWRSITLPKGHTWKSYMFFLLSTLPEKTAQNYKNKLSVSEHFWRTKGGEVALETIQELKDNNVQLSEGQLNPVTNRKKIQLEYLDDIEVKEFKLIPTYKRMCICILKNDHCCKFMGYGQNKYEMSIRKQAELKYANLTSI